MDSQLEHIVKNSKYMYMTLRDFMSKCYVDFTLRDFTTKREFNELKESIAECGVLSPIVIAEDAAGKYVIVDGVHRYYALQALLNDPIYSNVINADKFLVPVILLPIKYERRDVKNFLRLKFYAYVVNRFRQGMEDRDFNEYELCSLLANAIYFILESMPEPRRREVISAFEKGSIPFAVERTLCEVLGVPRSTIRTYLEKMIINKKFIDELKKSLGIVEEFAHVTVTRRGRVIEEVQQPQAPVEVQQPQQQRVHEEGKIAGGEEGGEEIFEVTTTSVEDVEKLTGISKRTIEEIVEISRTAIREIKRFREDVKDIVLKYIDSLTTSDIKHLREVYNTILDEVKDPAIAKEKFEQYVKSYVASKMSAREKESVKLTCFDKFIRMHEMFRATAQNIDAYDLTLTSLIYNLFYRLSDEYGAPIEDVLDEMRELNDALSNFKGAQTPEEVVRVVEEAFDKFKRFYLTYLRKYVESLRRGE